MSWIFWGPIHGNCMKIFLCQSLFKEIGREIDAHWSLSKFSKNFLRMCIFVFTVRVLKHQKNHFNISANVQKSTKKSEFFFWVCTKNLYFLTIYTLFKSTLNWLSITAKIMIVGRLTAEHLQFIKEICFKMPENSPSYDDFLQPEKMRIFQNKLHHSNAWIYPFLMM